MDFVHYLSPFDRVGSRDYIGTTSIFIMCVKYAKISTRTTHYQTSQSHPHRAPSAKAKAACGAALFNTAHVRTLGASYTPYFTLPCATDSSLMPRRRAQGSTSEPRRAVSPGASARRLRACAESFHAAPQ
eukprot:scaffold5118_cov118-Isochrysis_galbana.AAC.6